MIANLIRWSIRQRFLVLLAALFLAAWGVYSLKQTAVDALPDLSDVQVIVRTSWPGQAPQIVEDQVTYPLTTTMLSVPGAKTVRGYSSFGDSLVYVLFEDGTDLYWARSRVLEYLSQVQSRLPAGARAELGPDATGVGWIYEYALVDRTGKHDLAQLRALQDWFLRFELKTVPGVAEVASVGGMVKQYQIVLDPDRLRAYAVTHGQVIDAVQKANGEAGGAVLEMAEAEYMVRASGYLKSLDDFRAIPLKTGAGGVPVLLGDVARIQLGPEMRRGIADWNGEGEVAGGVIVMRSGKNAQATITAVKAKLAAVRASLPTGVEIVEAYDRSQLIGRAIENLSGKLLEEFLVVALVCVLFLFHLRSALVAIIALPLGVLAAFIVMHLQGINANLMSLGGIAIAIGAMVDAAIVMIENAHKHLEAWQHAHADEELRNDERWRLIADAASEVGPALFFSLLVITLSFVPVFTLEAQEGRLFGPLAFTKTYAMAAAAGLSVTLIPVLMGWWIRGRIPDERKNPITRGLIAIYEPALDAALRAPRMTLVVALVALLATAWPISQLSGEFLPPLDEGDVLYMPTALPGLSAGKAQQILQQTDAMIKTVPEVASVFGKAGRAETATDPAPLEMYETTVRFKPRDQWRPGMTMPKLIDELDHAVHMPGLTNLWVPPIRNRLDMLATGIKSPIGVKVGGPDLATIDTAAREIERVAKTVPGVTSAFAERLSGGRYVDVDIDRAAAARYGLNIADVQSVVSSAIGGENVGETIEGRQRFPISVRYPRELRDNVARLRELPIVTPAGAQITLGSVAKIDVADGPPMIRSENARLSGWIYVDVRGRSLPAVVEEMSRRVASEVKLPAGVSVAWSGQFEYYEHAMARLKVVVPATLLIIFVLLYLTFGRLDEAALILAGVPFALIGGFWFMYLLGHAMSIATAVGFIALAGVAAEFGVVMLLYLKHAWERRLAAGEPETAETLLAAIHEGAVQRVRPKAMTVAVILAGLLPILLGHGTGSEIMQRIAAPMVGGMVTAPLLSMFVIPVVYRLLRTPRKQRSGNRVSISAT
ncbi:MAG: efflux RND transporter permease subunit [Rudaea sp.]|uniref:efflux RND transporter permease subunit n=1 Tax=unclassified Rudaea TaxID=2627037 RepID=UPI0010F8EB95|nr:MULTISPECIES: efflux RND transporter permease subunit [unclassified Rudaea]MBN8888472.1 efflux RND transporter permease subunit [Rudaea sp.]MBR0345276.1 efflux RND transporter permease subunit [Rudaea sp.]